MTVFKDGAGNNIPTTWTNSFQILSRLEVNLQKQGLIEVQFIILLLQAYFLIPVLD